MMYFYCFSINIYLYLLYHSKLNSYGNQHKAGIENIVCPFMDTIYRRMY